MIIFKYFLLLFIISSCSLIGGPETKYEFLNEEVEEDMALPGSLDAINTENHYPVIDAEGIDNNLSLIHI